MLVIFLFYCSSSSMHWETKLIHSPVVKFKAFCNLDSSKKFRFQPCRQISDHKSFLCSALQNQFPMETNFFFLFLLILLSLFICCATKHCPDCGRTPVPYPLSTRPDCGDSLYKIRCTAGQLWFESVNGSSYLITSVNPATQRLIVRPPGLVKNTCVSSDFGSNGFWLNTALPFTFTNRNTILLFNCSMEVFENSWNCTPNGVCHDFMRQNPVAMVACKAAPTCCWYRSGGFLTAYRIRVRKERCSAYEGFVNLGGSVPSKKWPESGVEIQWAPPREPPCRLATDCRDWANSACSPEHAKASQRRCFCKVPFKWDPVTGLCNAAKSE